MRRNRLRLFEGRNAGVLLVLVFLGLPCHAGELTCIVKQLSEGVHPGSATPLSIEVRNDSQVTARTYDLYESGVPWKWKWRHEDRQREYSYDQFGPIIQPLPLPPRVLEIPPGNSAHFALLVPVPDELNGSMKAALHVDIQPVLEAKKSAHVLHYKVMELKRAARLEGVPDYACIACLVGKQTLLGDYKQHVREVEARGWSGDSLWLLVRFQSLLNGPAGGAFDGRMWAELAEHGDDVRIARDVLLYQALNWQMLSLREEQLVAVKRSIAKRYPFSEDMLKRFDALPQ
jgi:hypothetical protein